MATMDTTQRTGPKPERIASSFASGSLPLAAAALSVPSHGLVRELVTDLESRIDQDGPLDRLTVRVLPHLSPFMVAHYLNQGPALAKLVDARGRLAIDRRVAAVVTMIARLTALPALMHFVREDELSADALLAELLAAINAMRADAPLRPSISHAEAPTAHTREDDAASTGQDSPGPADDPFADAPDPSAADPLAAAPLLAELEALRTENAALRASGKRRLQVSKKGAVSLYGLQKFPVTLYANQWRRLLALEPDIRAFIAENAALL